MWSVVPGEVTGDEPVTLAEAKAQCRVDGADNDVLLGRLIKVAREVVEKKTGRVLRAQTLILQRDAFARALPLPRAPIASITAVRYIDSAGALTELDAASYALRYPLGVPTLRPSLLAGLFPIVARGGYVEIEVAAGYADGQVPETLRHAILIIVADLFKSAESSVEGLTSAAVAIPVSVESLLADERLSWL